MSWRALIGICCLLAAVFARAQHYTDSMDDAAFQQWAAGYFRPLPERAPGSDQDSPALIALGKRLFHDANLSARRNISCASCHPVEGGGAGADNLPRSPGTHGELGARNSPTVLNTAFNTVWFWDARARSLEAQAVEPLFKAAEMGLGGDSELLARLTGDAGYADAFKAAFPGDTTDLSLDKTLRAIAAFERSLVSPSRYDRYAGGDLTAMTAREVRGLRKFVGVDCKECHGGSTFGGQNADILGIKHPWPDQSDLGMFSISGNETEKMKFKVPSLRNVGLTAPYFHNGAVASLEEAVRLMAWHQKGIALAEQEIADIAAFLRALSDETRAANIPSEN